MFFIEFLGGKKEKPCNFVKKIPAQVYNKQTGLQLKESACGF